MNITQPRASLTICLPDCSIDLHTSAACPHSEGIAHQSAACHVSRTDLNLLLHHIIHQAQHTLPLPHILASLIHEFGLQSEVIAYLRTLSTAEVSL